MTELAKKSHEFPSTCETIQKVRKLYSCAVEWATSARKALGAKKKLSLQDARGILDEGDKLGFQCNVLRVLRNGLKAARGWSNRVKRCKIEDGGTHVKDIKALLVEHESLIVEIPEDVAKLQHASKNYCLCRRPYEGFMIGCDSCHEWFHGPCIVVSESKADKVSKYVCIRCSVSKVFKSSSATVADIIRKWTNKKDLKKARRVVTQKHQRKVRKEE